MATCATPCFASPCFSYWQLTAKILHVFYAVRSVFLITFNSIISRGPLECWYYIRRQNSQYESSYRSIRTSERLAPKKGREQSLP